jgi:hypothetical protein
MMMMGYQDAIPVATVLLNVNQANRKKPAPTQSKDL